MNVALLKSLFASYMTVMSAFFDENLFDENIVRPPHTEFANLSGYCHISSKIFIFCDKVRGKEYLFFSSAM